MRLHLQSFLFTVVTLLLISTQTAMASKTHLNVLKTPLALFSKEPMTGYYRNGYCQVGADDTGNHSIAATLTNPFLNFTASRGNNLRSIGLTEGCKWCLCAGRWKEALEYSKTLPEGSKEREAVVPGVRLESTSERAVGVVGLEDLKRWAVDGEGKGEGKGKDEL